MGWKARNRAGAKDFLRSMSDYFVVVCVSSLRFIFGMNVLQPKYNVNTRA